jgi:hypothetical protein
MLRAGINMPTGLVVEKLAMRNFTWLLGATRKLCGESQHTVEDDVTLLNSNVSNKAWHSLYPTFVWDQQGAADVKAGPEDDELMDLPQVHAVRPLRNQCPFIRSLTHALGDDDWERLQAKVAASADDRKSAWSPESALASVFGAMSSPSGTLLSLVVVSVATDIISKISWALSVAMYSREGTSKLIDSVSPEQVSASACPRFIYKCLMSPQRISPLIPQPMSLTYYYKRYCSLRTTRTRR